MSRLMQRLGQMQRAQDANNPKARAEKEAHALAGDGLEMAARVALEAWQERPKHFDESDTFRLGYRLACHELALVFRAMRKGQPPDAAEFGELKKLVMEDAAEECRGTVAPADFVFLAGDHSGALTPDVEVGAPGAVPGPFDEEPKGGDDG